MTSMFVEKNPNLTDKGNSLKAYVAQSHAEGSIATEMAQEIYEILEEYAQLNIKLQECQRRNKNLQIEVTNNHMFKQSYLSAYNQISDMDIEPTLKETILATFDGSKRYDEL